MAEEKEAKNSTSKRSTTKKEVIPTSPEKTAIVNTTNTEDKSALVAKEKLPDIDKKIELLKRFPDAKVVILSDNERGSLSNFLFSSMGVIDQARNEFKNVLNFKTEVTDTKEFYAGFAEYSEAYEKLMTALKEVEKHSIDLLTQFKKPSSIRSGMLRGMIERDKKQKRVTTNEKEDKTA